MARLAKSDGAQPRVQPTLSADQALELAIHVHRAGDIEDAEMLYGRILDAAPDMPEALHFLGIQKHQTGRAHEAVDLLRRAVSLMPDRAEMRSNLGNVLSEQERFAEAAESYGAAIALKPDFVEAHSNLGAALRRLARTDEAEASYRRAIELDPNLREAHENLGRLLLHSGRNVESLACFTRALELEPHNADTRRLLVSTHAAAKNYAKALSILDEWLGEEPRNPTALHLRAAISGENVPARAGDAYVETMFDRFAPGFDVNLAELDYQAPRLVGGALAAAAGSKRQLAILDAGCGTGLCAPHLAPFAAHLAGVDLSPRMLDRARARGGYEALHHGELTRFLLDHPGSWDAVVSADTLCYFGALDEVARATADALRPGGILVFTVEREDGPDPFRINTTGRYSHRRDYVDAVLVAAGLQASKIDQETLRVERGTLVAGLVVTACKPSG